MAPNPENSTTVTTIACEGERESQGWGGVGLQAARRCEKGRGRVRAGEAWGCRLRVGVRVGVGAGERVGVGAGER
eukprot:511155-Prymnesium_polylepis.1